jgi:hypothetical protein
MTDLTQTREAMLRRHRSALLRFAATSRLPADKLAFVIADANSKLGQATRQWRSVTRASIVIPITVDDMPRFAEVIGVPEVEQLRVEHGAVPVLVIDAEDRSTILWESLLPRQAAAVQNRSIKLFDDRDRG